MPYKERKKPELLMLRWWQTLPLFMTLFLIILTVTVVVLSLLFNPCASASNHNNGIFNTILYIALLILPLELLWHVGLIIFVPPMSRYLLYGIVNGLVSSVIWIYCLMHMGFFLCIAEG